MKWEESYLCPDHTLSPPTTAPATLLAASSVNGRKHSVDEHADALSTKRHRQKITAPAAISDVASSVCDLATAFVASGSSGDQTSPQHHAAAVKLIEEDDELSEYEQPKIFKVLHKDVAVADFVLAIKDKGKRTRYIQSELDDV